MSDIIPFLGAGMVFDPETTSAMSVAFEDVCRVLKMNGDAGNREVIASKIIELARRGERDAARLRDIVLRDVGVNAPATKQTG
jgi:hypothetical protein